MKSSARCDDELERPRPAEVAGLLDARPDGVARRRVDASADGSRSAVAVARLGRGRGAGQPRRRLRSRGSVDRRPVSGSSVRRRGWLGPGGVAAGGDGVAAAWAASRCRRVRRPVPFVGVGGHGSLGMTRSARFDRNESGRNDGRPERLRSIPDVAGSRRSRHAGSRAGRRAPTAAPSGGRRGRGSRAGTGTPSAGTRPAAPGRSSRPRPARRRSR